MQKTFHSIFDDIGDNSINLASFFSEYLFAIALYLIIITVFNIITIIIDICIIIKVKIN